MDDLAHLHDQGGAFMPVFFYSTGDYKSPTFVYLLAALFRITGPSTEGRARARRNRGLRRDSLARRARLAADTSVAVATGIVVLGGMTPWLYELGRVIWETCVPARPGHGAARARLGLSVAARLALASGAAGLALGALVYVYAEGRMLAFLFAGALLVFASRRCWRWLLATWASSPCRSSRCWSTSSGTELQDRAVARHHVCHPGHVGLHDRVESAWHYAQDVSLWHWVSSGDQKPYIHSWGAGQLFGSVVVLAAIGVFVVLRVRPLDRWVALRHRRGPALRRSLPRSRKTVTTRCGCSPIPVFLLVLAIPGLQLLFRRVPESSLARVVVVGLGIAVVGQFLWALHWYDVRGPDRRVFFEADVPRLLDLTLREKETNTSITTTSARSPTPGGTRRRHHIPLSQVIRPPDGGIPPNGSICSGTPSLADYRLATSRRAAENKATGREGRRPNSQS